MDAVIKGRREVLRGLGGGALGLLAGAIGFSAPSIGRSYPSLEEEVERHIRKLLESDTAASMFARDVERTTQYDDYIQEAASQVSMAPEDIMAVILTESQGNIRAMRQNKNGSSDAGLMQINSGTAPLLGLGVTDFYDERRSPKAILAGSRYLARIAASYGGEIILGIAGYNAGPPRLAGIVEKYGEKWEDISPHLPAITRYHVPKVLARREVLSDPQRYGLAIGSQPLFSEKLGNTLPHSLRKGETMGHLTRYYGTGLERLAEVNPEIPDYGKVRVGQEVRVPLERAST